MRIFLASATDHLTDHLPLSEGLIALSLMEGLSARGHDVVACADEVSVRAPVQTTVIPLGRTTRWESLTPYTRPRAIDRALAEHGRGAFDVIHWLFPQDPAGMRLPRSRGARKIIGPLMGEWPPGAPRAKRVGDYVRTGLGPSLRRRHNRVMRDADVLLAAHPEALNALPDEFQAKAVLIGFGIDETRFTPSPLPDLPVFLFVGRLIEEKGVRSLLNAFSAVSKVVPEAKLMIVGDGPLMAWIRDYRRDAELTDHVEIVGSVPHREMPELLRRCSALCLPSVGEPYGMAVVEAMAAGRAVIAVDRAGPAHLLRKDDGGRRVPPNNVDALASAMAELGQDAAKLRAMGAANRRHVLAELTCSHMVDQVEAVYEGRLLPSGSAGRPRLGA